MTSRHAAIFLLFALTIGSFIGCDSISMPHDNGGVDSTIYKIDFEFRVKNFRPLRPGEFYSLWVKQRPDSTWRLASDSNFNRFQVLDSTSIYGRFFSPIHPDSIYEAIVTIELTKKPSAPGIALLRANVLRDTGFLTMAHLGNFSKATGGLTFTSKSLTDPEAYKREFYLINLNNGTPQSSIAMLPQLNSGWRYGLWAADYEFFPYHEFLYGLFDDPVGYDSDSAGDAYPFPGGAKKQRMDVPTGRIIVTLEPPLYGDSLRYHGAELLYILQLNRFEQIERDKFYPMGNVSGGWLPFGRITFIKR
jgi:hypothetical protein